MNNRKLEGDFSLLNSRMKNILRELYAVDQPITGNYLANLNQVTTRTTREDIKNLDAILNNHGAKIVPIIAKGYKLEISDEKAFRKFLQSISVEQIGQEYIPSTPEERVAYLIRRLLLSNRYEKLDDLADELYISKSTIQLDLKTVKQIFDEYGIVLKSKPNFGIKASGSEIKLRFCLSEYLFDRNDDHTNTLVDTPFSSISKEDIDQIHKIILKQIQKHQISMSDIAINNLCIHIAIAYKRIVSGHHVVLVHSDIEEIKQQKEYQVATEIAADVENYYHVKFPQQEIAYIAMHLLGTKLLSQTKSQVDHVINDEILHLVHFVLEKIEEQLELGIQNDQELILGLSLHLKPAVNRIKFGMNIRNPMLQDIKNNYPLAYEAGIIAGIAVKEYTGIEMDENEIGYLALHFGAAIERKKLQSGPKRCLVVCASGLGTAQLIFYRLKSYFGHNLEVVGTTEYYKLKQMNLNGIDFIVSSIPIQESFHIPVIEVNAVLKEQDLKSIEKFIVNQNTRQPILSYFHKDLTFLKEKLATQEKALEFLNDVLLDKGLVDDTFLEAIYEREKVAPTAFGNLVAIPHPITPKTKKTFVVVCTLVKPIIWSETPVQIIFLLCVKKDSQEDLQEMYDLLGKFIENKAMVQNILKAKTYEDFIHVIRE